jgi:hypothetical protein
VTFHPGDCKNKRRWGANVSVRVVKADDQQRPRMQAAPTKPRAAFSDMPGSLLDQSRNDPVMPEI